MAKRRNHFLPQFLLRRFSADASRRRIWQFRTGAGAKLIGVRDAAVADLFYGEASTGIEEAFVDIEGRQATLLRELDEGRPPSEVAEPIRHFAWTQLVRTRAFRQQFRNAITGMLVRFAATAEQSAPEAMRRVFSTKFDDLMESALQKLPPSQQQVVRVALG